jgi:uncharacterized membrane protein
VAEILKVGITYEGVYMEGNDLGRTSTGINPTVAGLLCYLLGFITGIIFLILEKENRFVRFHAMQSIFTSVFFFILNGVLHFIPFIGWVLIPIVGIVAFILWILLMVKAYKGEYYKLPVVGDMAEQKL